jgi:hypothetical protein
VGALANLGFLLSDQTVGNILRRDCLCPAPKRKPAICWKDFIRSRMEVLVGTDFFTVEVVTLNGLVTYYVLFFIQLESWRVCLAGMRLYPGHEFCASFRELIAIEERGHDSPAREEPEFELVCLVLGEIGQRGMPVEADSVRGGFTAASVAAICGALPRGAQPLG